MKTLAASFQSFRSWPLIPKVLLLLGLLGPLGFVTNFVPLKGLGIAWMVSPLPIVFSDANGFEAFAAKFDFRLELDDGTILQTPITFREASKLRGPYNRRNVYGAIIGYAPRLPIGVVRSALEYGFCKSGTLLEEFELPRNVNLVQLNIQDGTVGREANHYRYEVTCNR